jgi:hypothetical protein
MIRPKDRRARTFVKLLRRCDWQLDIEDNGNIPSDIAQLIGDALDAVHPEGLHQTERARALAADFRRIAYLLREDGQ